MLMDHMGYKNYRDIDKFLETLITNKHVTEDVMAKLIGIDLPALETYDLTNKKRAPLLLPNSKQQDNISMLIDRFCSNWCGRIPLQEEYTKFPHSFLKARVPWLTSDEFYLFGCNNKKSPVLGLHPLNGWTTTSAGRTARIDISP